MYYQQRVRGDKPYPIPEGFFRPLQLSSERLAELRAEAADALQSALIERNEYLSSHGMNAAVWRLHAEHDGLREYKRAHESLPTTSLSLIAGHVDGNYRELVRFYRSETREQYFNVQKKLFHYTADAVVLLNVPQEAGSPIAYEGVKWAVYDPFSLRFRMDSCHFETTGTGVDANGKPYAFRVVLPAVFSEVPDLFKTKRTVRMTSKSVMLTTPSSLDPSKTEFFMSMQNDFRSNRVPRSMYKQFLISLTRIGFYLDSRRVVSRSVLAQNEWIPETQRDDCAVCARSFSVLRSRYNCSGCGDTVCRKCLLKSSDIQPVSHRDEAAAKMCLQCIKLLREDQEHHALPTPMGDFVWPKASQRRSSEAPTEMSSLHNSNRGGEQINTQPEASSANTDPKVLRVRFESDPSDWRTDSASGQSTFPAPLIDRSHSLSSPGIPAFVRVRPALANASIAEEEDDLAKARKLFNRTPMRMGYGWELRPGTAARPLETSSEVFQKISMSLFQQELLLRQLQQAAIGLRTTAEE